MYFKNRLKKLRLLTYYEKICSSLTILIIEWIIKINKNFSIFNIKKSQNNCVAVEVDVNIVFKDHLKFKFKNNTRNKTH